MTPTREGKPCTKCESTERYVNGGCCVLCAKARALAHKALNKSRTNQMAKERNALNPEIRKAERARNRDTYNKLSRKWKANNKGKVNAATMNYKQTKRRAMPPWVDKKEIEGFYIMAERVGKCMGIPHHVDHVIPLRGELVCGLHVPSNLRVVPEKVNLRKGNKMNHEWKGGYVGESE